MEYLWRDFCYFQAGEGNYGDPAIRISFLNKEPPWKEIPPRTVPLSKHQAAHYKVGPNRYVDHDGEVLVIYDLKRDQGTVYSLDPDAMYRIAYGIIMTRVGCRLDRPAITDWRRSALASKTRHFYYWPAVVAARQRSALK